MRNLILGASLLLVSLLSTGCGYTVVKPGYVGIRVNNMGESRGVQDYPIRTGIVWYNLFSEDVHIFPVHQQTVRWTKNLKEGEPNESIDFNAGVDRVNFNVDVGVSIEFRAEKVPHIFVKFRKDPDILIDGVIRNEIKDEFGRVAATYDSAGIIASRRGEFLDTVKRNMNAKFKDEGIVFDSVTFLGDARIPETILHAINSANTAAQKAREAEYMIAVKEAEGKQRIAQAEADAKVIQVAADAQAYAQNKIAASTSPAIIELKRIEKWNGELPTVTSGALPFWNLNK